MLSRPQSLWTWLFVSLNVAQAVVSLGLQIDILFTINFSVGGSDSAFVATKVPLALLTYLVLIYVYQLVLVYDTIDKQNTFQAIGLAFSNLWVCIYVGVSLSQFRAAVLNFAELVHIDLGVWDILNPLLLANISVIALSTVANCFIVYKLYEQFAWRIYARLRASPAVKYAYGVYEILMALLKFDFIFYTGFFAQLMVVNSTSTSLGISSSVLLPLAIILVIAAPYCVRYETDLAMGFILTLQLAFVGYLMYFLSFLCTPSPELIYLPVRRLLTAYTIVTVVLGVVTSVAMVVCWKNFNRGLKPQLLAPRLAFEQAMDHKNKMLKRVDQDEVNWLLMTDLIPKPWLGTASSSALPRLPNLDFEHSADDERKSSHEESHLSAPVQASGAAGSTTRRATTNVDAIEPV